MDGGAKRAILNAEVSHADGWVAIEDKTVICRTNQSLLTVVINQSANRNL